MKGLRFQGGLTLLELMLIVALVATLASFGVHSYRGYVEGLREDQAIVDINRLSIQLYRWRTSTGSFPESLAEAGLDGETDPWGGPYRYLKIATAPKNEVRKDKNLHPLNTDFDLYSLGRDGDSKVPLTAKASRDDIIRANNGGFVGRGEEY